QNDWLLSPRSSDSHADSTCASASHSATTVVLPKPGGADTSVSFAASAWRKRSLRRLRNTTCRRRRGTKSFVSSSTLAADSRLTLSASRISPHAGLGGGALASRQ